MTLTICHKGKKLDQAHLDIFVEVFNEQLDGKVKRGQKALEAECEKRWQEAGIPLSEVPGDQVSAK